MEKRKPWQFVLILAVVLLTVFNILPTVFYYSNPLKAPVREQKAHQIATDVVQRVNQLEDDAKGWLKAFCHHLGVKPKSIEFVENNPGLIEVTFRKSEEADAFKLFLPKAGSLIPFSPAQLALSPLASSDPQHKILVQRYVAFHMSEDEVDTLFTFTKKVDDQGDGKRNVADFYRSLVYDRVSGLAIHLAGSSLPAEQLQRLSAAPASRAQSDLTLSLAREIVEMADVFGSDLPLVQRFFSSYSQIDLEENENQESFIHQFLSRLESAKTEAFSQRDHLLEAQKKWKEEQGFADDSQEETIDSLTSQGETLETASKLVRQNITAFSAGLSPLTKDMVSDVLRRDTPYVSAFDTQTIDLGNRNPYVKQVIIDWANDQVILALHNDVEAMENTEDAIEEIAIRQEKLHQLVIGEVARVSRLTDEAINPKGVEFVVQLNHLTNSTGLLALNLGAVADKQVQQLTQQLLTTWHPRHPDLIRENFPIWDYHAYRQLPTQEGKLGLVVYAPTMTDDPIPDGFQPGSLYVIARGLNHILEKYREYSDTEDAQMFLEDFQNVSEFLKNQGFGGYSGASPELDPEYRRDVIFRLDNTSLGVLQASREDFTVHGSQRYATLEFTNVEQRIHSRNKIDDAIHEDLLKWKEEYGRAQVDLDKTAKYTVPPPIKNAMWENLKLGAKKYVRGDNRKILKWGLDLSGGKTVRIGLRDQNNQPVNDPADLKQAVNELYTRINKMGVSERTIRIENQHILLEFPGAQELTASELIKGSAMTFHIVNEKFGFSNPDLAETVQRFLKGVWDEAVVTNRKDVESLNEIAWRHLGGSLEVGLEDEQTVVPQTEIAKTLYENGLRLPSPQAPGTHVAFDDTLSAVAVLRGEDPSEWHGNTHPLMIVFRNYALEGASLEGVQAAQDPGKGNILQFGVTSSYASEHKGGGVNPRDDFYAWTSQFSEEKIVGTPREVYSKGRGWRMAVILNDTVISAPSLLAPLRDGGIISGNFSPREVSLLAADLKAGSLTFTPHILSEMNISADLGKQERAMGIMATIFGLCLVVIVMISYYRFAGIIAAMAVLFNLLIMWGVLQNLGAALTLPGLAGLILTVGMAVDANVLVFERIREEFGISGRIASAIQTGYRKAFSAIIDSNITTIIAALILLQFDVGPIRGFAIILIIGILSSMFTALFLTRYFFAGWTKNPKNKALKMMDLIGHPNIDFLGKAKKVIACSVVIIVIGNFMLFEQRHSIFGLEFTGGYSFTVELEEQAAGTDYRRIATDALISSGAVTTDFQIKRLNKPNQLNIQFGTGMEEEERPFYEMPEEVTEATEGDFVYSYQRNPRQAWTVNTISSAGLQVKETQMEHLDQDWSVMSSQFSDVMRNQAIMALGLALVAILVYITFRFEFKFAISAIIALVHDVFISLGCLAFLHYLGMPMQITMETVGALMTIIGYSLNDTIIIFDRIREDQHLMRKAKFHEVVSHAINITLGRTLMTSGTTLVVLLALSLLGGQAIFGFSFIMALGVVFGTLSSLFIACPAMLYFHRREEREQEKNYQLKKA